MGVRVAQKQLVEVANDTLGGVIHAGAGHALHEGVGYDHQGHLGGLPLEIGDTYSYERSVG